jgi:hypothetical protein
MKILIEKIEKRRWVKVNYLRVMEIIIVKMNKKKCFKKVVNNEMVI